MSAETFRGIEWRLPDHAAETVAMFSFPHGADSADALWFRTEDDGSVRLMAMVSDFFAWACADAEEITADDLPALRQAFADLKPLDKEHQALCLLGELFASRKRGELPAEFVKLPDPVAALFQEATP